MQHSVEEQPMPHKEEIKKDLVLTTLKLIAIILENRFRLKEFND